MTSERSSRIRSLMSRLTGTVVLLSVVFALAGLGTVWFSFSGDSRSSITNSNGDSLTVYLNLDDCNQSGVQSCEQHWDKARETADVMTWGYAGAKDCTEAYGKNCSQNRNGDWHPEMQALALFEKNFGSFKLALPVFSSTTYPGLYLPNSYPLIAGKNTVTRLLRSVGTFGASKPTGLTATVCFKSQSGKTCGQLHEFVSGLNADEKVLSKIF